MKRPPLPPKPASPPKAKEYGTPHKWVQYTNDAGATLHYCPECGQIQTCFVKHDSWCMWWVPSHTATPGESWTRK